MNRADLIGGVGLTAFGLLLIFVIIPGWTVSGTFYGLPPTLFPTVMAAGLTVSAVGLTLQAIRRRAMASDDRPSPMTAWNLAMFLLAGALAVLGVIGIDYLGVIYAGPMLIAAFMLFMGERSVLHIALTATLPVALVYLMARHVLHAPLP